MAARRRREVTPRSPFVSTNDAIQEAQKLIDEAGQALCPVAGFAKQWRMTATVYDRVKTWWHQVNKRLQEIVRYGDNRRRGKGCPVCGAPLPCDGSCCDECGWTRPVAAATY